MGSARRDVSATRRRFRLLFYLLIVSLTASALLAASACTNVIVPPRVVHDPQTVYLVDHGRTPSLVVPDDEGGMVRYGYGDWNWYARGRTGTFEAIAVLLWPTQGALGRLELEGPADELHVREQVRIVIEDVYAVTVEREAVQRLREKLDRIFEENRDTLLNNELSQFEFVHHPERYSAFNNSSSEIADWLEDMGAEVKGLALISEWRVERDD